MLQWAPREDGTVDLRIDDSATRIRLHDGPRDDLAYAGWEVRDAAALASLAARLEAEGVAVEPLDPANAVDRRVRSAIRLADPEGNTYEAFFGPLQRTNRSFVSPTGTRFKTGPQGLGHLVLSCRDKPAMRAFFIELLGFQVSDHIRTEVVPGRPLKISVMRCNGRHNSLALTPLPIPKKIIHLMVETASIDDVGRALDRCMAAGRHLTFTLGRHSNDDMISFYQLSPSGFDVDYGWGGLEADDRTWHVLTHDANSAWGHKYQRPPWPAKPKTAA